MKIDKRITSSPSSKKGLLCVVLGVLIPSTNIWGLSWPLVSIHNNYSYGTSNVKNLFTNNEAQKRADSLGNWWVQAGIGAAITVACLYYARNQFVSSYGNYTQYISTRLYNPCEYLNTEKTVSQRTNTSEIQPSIAPESIAAQRHYATGQMKLYNVLLPITNNNYYFPHNIQHNTPLKTSYPTVDTTHAKKDLVYHKLECHDLGKKYGSARMVKLCYEDHRGRPVYLCSVPNRPNLVCREYVENMTADASSNQSNNSQQGPARTLAVGIRKRTPLVAFDSL